MKRFYETYAERFNSPPATILEIGSRDGNDAEYLRFFSSADPWNVFIVEPHPESFRSIIEKYPLFNVYNLAISDKPGVVKFNAIPPTQYPPSVVGTSSLLNRNKQLNIKNAIFPERWINVLAIDGYTLLQLIDKSEIDAVKIDVEGFSWEVLKSFGDSIRVMKALHIEVELPPLELWVGQKYHEDISYLMNWYNYEEKYYDGKYWQIGTGEKCQGDSVWVRKD